jgi:hypothetical protein
LPKSISTGGSPTKRYLQKLRKLQTAMLEIEEIYRVERRRGIVARSADRARSQEGVKTGTGVLMQFPVSSQYRIPGSQAPAGSL